MDRYTVLAVLNRYRDTSSDGEQAALAACSAAIEQITARLRPGADDSDPRLAGAAAGLALRALAAKEALSSGGARRVRAGDVEMETNSASLMRYAREVCDELLAAAAPLLADSGFVFRQVGHG
jgi:hypothetical protein